MRWKRCRTAIDENSLLRRKKRSRIRSKFRLPIREPVSRQRLPNIFSNRSSQPSRMEWVWAFLFRGRLSKIMADEFGSNRIPAGVRFSRLPCRPSKPRKKPMPGKTVHVVDDDAAMRDSLRFLLKSAKLDVRTYESADAFLRALPEIKGGCVLTDVRMPGLSGIDLLHRLKKTPIDLPVIVMTGHGDVTLAVEAMKEGAIDFLEKPFDDEVLLKATRSALDRYEKDAKKGAEKAEILSRLALLSQRERQVLEGLIAGQPNKVIAADHQISPRTVEIYRAHVMSKMQADSLSELVRMALVAGLLEK